MKPQVETRTRSTDPLEEILREEIGACQDILQATEAAAAAIGNGNLEAFRAAGTNRTRAIQKLADFASRAEKFRASASNHGENIPPLLRTLQEFAVRIHKADADARQAAERAVGALKQQIQALHVGRNGLRGYRGPTTPIPRFSDRRG